MIILNYLSGYYFHFFFFLKGKHGFVEKCQIPFSGKNLQTLSFKDIFPIKIIILLDYEASQKQLACLCGHISSHI